MSRGSRLFLSVFLVSLVGCTPARVQLVGPPAEYSRSLMVENDTAFAELHMARALDRAADAELICATVDFPMARACSDLEIRRKEVHRTLRRYERYQGALLSAAAHQKSRRVLRDLRVEADRARELYVASIFALSAPSLAILGEPETFVMGDSGSGG